MSSLNRERGQRVVVKCANGEFRENLVWEWNEHMVYVCSERQYTALQEGRDAPPPIGFREEDVQPVTRH